jgi:hypothetical protein
MVVNMPAKGVEHKVKKSPKIAAKKPKREVKVKPEIAAEGLKVMPTGIAALDGPIGAVFLQDLSWY